MSVRINGLDTHYMYRDVVDIMEQAGDRVHTLLVPVVWACPADLYNGRSHGQPELDRAAGLKKPAWGWKR